MSIVSRFSENRLTILKLLSLDFPAVPAPRYTSFGSVSFVLIVHGIMIFGSKSYRVMWCDLLFLGHTRPATTWPKAQQVLGRVSNSIRRMLHADAADAHGFTLGYGNPQRQGSSAVHGLVCRPCMAEEDGPLTLLMSYAEKLLLKSSCTSLSRWIIVTPGI